MSNSKPKKSSEPAKHPVSHSGSKYLRTVQLLEGDLIDVYCVIDAFQVTCPARQHAIKKLLCSGLRGKGDAVQDLIECRDAVSRAIQLEENRARSH